MTKQVRINLNDFVKVKLTARGMQLLCAYCERLNVRLPKADAEGFYRFNLYHLMYIFCGDGLAGSAIPFEGGIIYL